MRMLQAGREMDLPLEPVRVHAGAEFHRNDFDDDFAAERGFGGGEDPRHPPAAEFGAYVVGGAEGLL
jgi:hypothetical protein